MTRSQLYSTCIGSSKIIWQPFLGALCTYREARGESPVVQYAQACSLVNRLLNPGWWGTDIPTVVLKPWQYSSFNFNDPNNTVWPLGVRRISTNMWGLYQNNLLGNFLTQVISDAQRAVRPDPAWFSCLESFNNAVIKDDDPTLGATNYFDSSLDNKPPRWAIDGTFIHTVEIGRLRFWRPVPKEATA